MGAGNWGWLEERTEGPGLILHPCWNAEISGTPKNDVAASLGSAPLEGRAWGLCSITSPASNIHAYTCTHAAWCPGMSCEQL